MSAFQVIGYIGFVASCVGAVACRFVIVVNMFRAVALQKPDVPLRWSLRESPFNILFRPNDLTKRGKTARSWCSFGVVGFLLSFLLAVLVGVVTGVGQ